MKALKKENGIALPLVLIIMLVLTLLGTAVWQYSLSELRQAEQLERKTKAYYVARSGADAMARYLINNPESIEEIMNGEVYQVTETMEFTSYFNEGLEEFEEGGEKIGDLTVSIEAVGENIMVTGSGQVESINEEASVLLRNLQFEENVAFVITGDNVVSFQDKMLLDGSGIIKSEADLPNSYYETESGSGIYTDGSNVIYIGEANYPFPPDYFNPVIIPDNLTDMADIKNGNFSMNAGERLKYGSISSNNNNSFVINTSAGVETILVVENSLSLKTRIQVRGNGRADLYILKDATFQTPNEITEVAPEAQLNLYLFDNAELLFQAGSYFEGLIYGPNAAVRMQAQPVIYGAMIVGALTGSKDGQDVGGPQSEIHYKYGFGDEYFQPVVSIINWLP